MGADAVLGTHAHYFHGVEKVKFIPLVKRPGQTERAKKSAPEILKNFIELCKEFNTPAVTSDNVVEITFSPPPRESKIVNDFATDKQEKHLIAPLDEPRPEWIVDKVPEEAIIPPQHFGALKLVGYYVPPECRKMTEKRMLHVETYWQIDELIDKDFALSIRDVPVR